MSPVTRIALGSIAIGLLVLGLKFIAWRLTGSVALLSDALESMVNVATALAALLAVRMAARPATDRHPYGYHKAEYFSAVLEGVLIVTAAALILREAWAGLLDPRLPDAPVPGLALNAAAGVINAIWCTVLIRAGRRHRSPALLADGRHLLTDVITSAGVIVGIIAALLTGWAILDPILAALVALNILWSGWRVIRESLGGLLDLAANDADLARIRDAIRDNADGALEVHDLRTRQAGPRLFVDFHLVVPAQMTVSRAHDICDRLEAALRALHPDTQVTIHVEPEDKAKKSGVLVI